MTATDSPWPKLLYSEWADTCTTLHLWTQIVGKIRLAQSAWINHSWHVTLYVTPRGLTTSPMPWGREQFQIDFDFIDHRLVATTSTGATREMALSPMSVAAFHRRLSALLGELGIDVHINALPNEVPDPIPFHADEQHASYDADAAHRFWRVLLQCDRVFKVFRARFTGKCSPVHFFWGSNDLAVTRFSGRPAPEHPGGVPNLPDPVTREAYNQEVSSAGFWPGGGPLDQAAFYSYAYPVPAGFGERRVAPDSAYFDPTLGEFLLPYEAVRTADDPDGTLLTFLQSTYEAAAETARWERRQLEREPVRPR
ncbi:DUF5996 family protein [uncultured Thiohalocapsa sp.]|uniref:DUF5996 family protein n=1 Tax=uncultured Thiohalocapsa sp. TaxID=768990 RepID=UPI0025D55776|nr:DUF5996 family protein [uncultured Thiohalocapsa sp.]